MKTNNQTLMHPVIALDRASFNQGVNAKYDFEITDSGVNSTIVAKGPSAVAYGVKNRGGYGEEMENKVQYIVRRLTPIECARLQGFPDCWGIPDTKKKFTEEEYRFWLDVRNTHAAINGKAVKEYTKDQMLRWYNKLHTDSSEYKMWGNGVALPCVQYVMEGIFEAINKEEV